MRRLERSPPLPLGEGLPPDPRLGRWSRLNRLIAQAAARAGARVEELTDVHTDHFLRLVRGEQAVVVAKTRSPFLTQLAQHLSNNKYVSRRLMAQAGVPVVEDALVEDLSSARDVAIAQEMLARHGQLVVKPNWGNRGVGVVAGVDSLARLRRAFRFAVALDMDEEVLLERFRPGQHLRVAVIAGRAAAACLIEHLHLVGDGRTSVAGLVARVNADARRGAYGEGVLSPLDQLEPDEDTDAYLRVLGLRRSSRLKKGEVLPVWTEEAEVTDVTDAVHPDTLRAAEAACAALGVDVGGVDLMVEDVTRPLDGGRNGCVLEVNVLPALHLHALPTRGTARPEVFDAFVRYVLGDVPRR